MFDTLLASSTIIGAPRARPVMAALLFHILLIAAAVSSTASPDAGPRPVARDTIRLALTEQATSSPPKSPESLRPGPDAVIPRVPRVPSIPLDAPEFQPPRLSLSPLGRPESSQTSLHRNFGESRVSGDSSRPLFSTIEVDELPEPVEGFQPRYPDELRRAGVSGLVQVQYVVGSDGRVDEQSIRVLASSHPAFLLAALQALRGSRFKPARRGGRPVAVLVQQTIRFWYR
jgi:periplasmic protein TonB